MVFEFQVITLDIEGHKPSLDSLNVTLQTGRRESGVQRSMDKMQKINRVFGDFEFKLNKRKDDIVTVYQKIVATFEQWLITVIKKLDSGELLTTDILVFEDNLTVTSTLALLIIHLEAQAEYCTALVIHVSGLFSFNWIS